MQTELAFTLAKNATNHTTTDHKEGEQLEDRRNVGESRCNSGDGTDLRVQSLMFTMMIMNTYRLKHFATSYKNKHKAFIIM
jgi:hypothetical protein